MTECQRIPIDPALVPIVLDGTKIMTFRRGVKPFHLGPAEFFWNEGTVPVFIRSLAVVRVSELNGAHAFMEGHKTVSDLKAALRKRYPDLEESEQGTAIGFEVVNG